jgi:D-alanyl-D-alanine carboxypeptidase
MMTLYMLFEALRDNRVQLSTPIVMSYEAASRPPSKLGIPPGSSITVEQAILALVTKSANDVAAAVGEHLGGTEERFGQMMTLRARSIGMTRTTFRNASGLPDFEQTTTARDMATLGRRLIQDFPNRYQYFSTVHANIGRIRLRNHNRMLDSYDGVDGIKTGYIRDSGFNIVTSAERNGVRLVGAVFGGRSWTERDQHMAMLLDQGFERMGVAPRAPSAVMASAPARTGILGTAAAATMPSRAPVTNRTASALGSSGTARTAAAPQRHRAVHVSRSSSSSVRVVQGARAPAATTRSGTVSRTSGTAPAATTSRQRRG